jgi:hypothetical protein
MKVDVPAVVFCGEHGYWARDECETEMSSPDWTLRHECSFSRRRLGPIAHASAVERSNQGRRSPNLDSIVQKSLQQCQPAPPLGHRTSPSKAGVTDGDCSPTY